jgi:dUTP pyrophosphatase
MSLQVKFKKLNANTKLPVKGSLEAACFDVYTNSITFKNGKAVYGLGFATQIPKGYRGVIVPRSNLSKHPWIMANSIGIIDSDYRGEWMMVLAPLTGDVIETALPYGVGERCAQIYFEPVLETEFIQTEDLEDTNRGTGGFGSTGTKTIGTL